MELSLWRKGVRFFQRNTTYVRLLVLIAVIGSAGFFFGRWRAVVAQDKLADARFKEMSKAGLELQRSFSKAGASEPDGGGGLTGAFSEELRRVDKELWDLKFWATFWEVFSEVAIFLITASLIHLLYFWRVKTEDDHALKELSAEFKEVADTSIKSMVDGCLRYGLHGVRPELDYKEIFENAQTGDHIAWLTTYHPTLDEPAIKAALRRGVSFSVLTIDEGNPASFWRARDLSEDQNDPEAFTDGVTAFHDALRRLSAYAPQQTATPIGTFRFRKYLDLPGQPMCIISRAGAPVQAFVGHYLDKPSYTMQHEEWRQGTSADPNDNFIQKLATYFNKKWDFWANPYLPQVGGEWNYLITNGDGHLERTAAGTVTITQAGCELQVEGHRTMTLDKPVNVPWGTTGDCRIAQIFRTGNPNNPDYTDVLFEYVYGIGEQQSRRGYCHLKISKLNTDADKLATELQGEFFLVSPIDTIKKNGSADTATTDAEKGGTAEEEVIPHSGKIVFTRVSSLNTNETLRPVTNRDIRMTTQVNLPIIVEQFDPQERAKGTT